MEMTAESVGSTVRETSWWMPEMMAPVAATASLDWCGLAPCAETPLTITWKVWQLAMLRPGVVDR